MWKSGFHRPLEALALPHDVRQHGLSVSDVLVIAGALDRRRSQTVRNEAEPEVDNPADVAGREGSTRGHLKKVEALH